MTHSRGVSLHANLSDKELVFPDILLADYQLYFGFLQKQNYTIWKYLFLSPADHHIQSEIHILKDTLRGVCEYLSSHSDGDTG